MWIELILLSLLIEFTFYDEFLMEYQERCYWGYLIISFFCCLLFRTYLKDLMIDIYNYFFIREKQDVRKKKAYDCYRYFYCNKKDECDGRNIIFKIMDPLGLIILWLSIFFFPMIRPDLLLPRIILDNINLGPIGKKVLCVILSIVLMRIYIEIVFCFSVRCWDKNRKHIIITGDGDIQYIEKNKEFIHWILHMCQEDAVFYLEKNTRLEECILDLLQKFFEYNRSMKLEDYVRILNRDNLEDINVENISKVCYIHFISSDGKWNCRDKKIEGETENIRSLENYQNILIFHSKEQTVNDGLGNAIIKNIDQLANISQIMETEIFKNQIGLRQPYDREFLKRLIRYKQ